MRFMDPKLLLRANDTVSTPKQNVLFAEFNKQCQEYERSLPPLKNRLSKTAWKYFYRPGKPWPLWDSNLISFTVGDDPDFGPTRTPFKFHGPTAELRIIDFSWDHIYTFRYKGLGEISCRMPRGHTQLVFLLKEQKPLMQQCSPKFDCLFIEELTAVDEKLLRHELFFRSRSSIVVEFEKVVIEREAVNGKRVRRK